MIENTETRLAFLLINGRVYYLTKPEVIMGRSRHNDLIIPDLRISRMHAKLSRINDRYLLVDLNSTGGTFVNERPIVQKLLDSGDEVSLANSVYLTFHQNPEALPPNVQLYSPEAQELLNGGTTSNTQVRGLEEDEQAEA
ncbi:MAG: FHA domain-containing protein [Anaerolineales bacterium]|nr:FHA domain-containing protein [Anaerolineales bacterium]